MRASRRTEQVIIEGPSPWDRLTQSIGAVVAPASPSSRGRFRPGLSGSDVTQVSTDMPPQQRFGGLARPVVSPARSASGLAESGLAPVDLGLSPFAGFRA